MGIGLVALSPGTAGILLFALGAQMAINVLGLVLVFGVKEWR